MCICFICINNDPQRFPFWICLASNRDEFFARPSAPLHRWLPPDDAIIGGSDISNVTPGTEGGTWLAVNTKTGKIGVLLNIRDRSMQPAAAGKSKLSRGTLVPAYLRSPAPAAVFAKEVLSKCERYDPFLLLMLEPDEGNNGSYQCHYVSNLGSQYENLSANPENAKNLTVNLSSSVECVSAQKSELCKTFAFGNSHPGRPFLKVKNGLNKFKELINSAGEDQPAVSEQLFALMSTTDKHFPDDVLAESFPAGYPMAFLEKLSSINVQAYEKGYGTRAQTVLLLDFSGNCSMEERDTIPEQYRDTGKAVESSRQTVKMHFQLERRI